MKHRYCNYLQIIFIKFSSFLPIKTETEKLISDNKSDFFSNSGAETLYIPISHESVNKNVSVF